MYKEIEKSILNKINKKHFTFKDEIIKEVAKNIDTSIYKYYEDNYFRRSVTSAEKIVEFEFGRSIKMICNDNELAFAMSNKAMKEVFHLKNNKKIIFDNEYFETMKKFKEVQNGYIKK